MIEIDEPRVDTVVDYEAWKLSKGCESFIDHYTSLIADHRGVEYIGSLIAGYLAMPVGIYKQQIVEAITLKTTDLSACYLALKDKHPNGILLYGVWYEPSAPVYETFDVATYTRVPVTPRFTDPSWVLRYVPL